MDSRLDQGRQGDAKVFKKYSQMKLQMKREALGKLNRQANESELVLVKAGGNPEGFSTVLLQFDAKAVFGVDVQLEDALK